MATKHPAQPAKPPLVLVHGFRGAPIGLTKIAEHLEAAGYQVFLPPIPPFGGAKPLSAYTPTAYADYLANYIKSQRLRHPVLIGHSMGSIVASATAELHPELVSPTLILLSPISRRPAAFFRSLTPLSTLLPASLIDHITTRFLFIPHDRQLYRHTLVLTHTCSHLGSPRRREVFRAAQFSTRYSIADFPLQHQNLYLLAGTQDRLIPLAATEQLAATYHAHLTPLPGTGHLHNYERPQQTATAILKILADKAQK